ncbi:MAG: transporter substrate-binding domain-containing protein [Oscillospiraceae bacterium]|nr:transporter substrate-binding domain-containing protein [Oscillospiraceae bacterium]
MKKLLVLILALTLALSIAACTPSTAPATGSGTATDTPDSNVDQSDNNDDASTIITSIADLETAVIGVQRATTGHLFVEENFPDASIDAFPAAGDAILALNAGSVDAVVIDSLPAARFVFLNPGLKILEGDLTAEYYGIAFQLGSAYTAMFDEAINTLRANGTLGAIYDYWVNENPDASRYVTPEGTAHPNGTLLMATNAGFPPFEFWEGAHIVGFDVCLSTAIGDVLGYEIEIIDMDFDSIILSVQAGSADFGMAGMTIREDRREFVDFTQGYFNASQVVIVRTP